MVWWRGDGGFGGGVVRGTILVWAGLLVDELHEYNGMLGVGTLDHESKVRS